MLEMMHARAAMLAADKAQHILREFNEMVPVLKGLGLAISDVSLEMGLPPEISACVTGSVDSLDLSTIKTLQESHASNKTVVILLEGLAAASNFRDTLTNLGFRGIRLDIKLGLLPSVKVALMPAVLSGHGLPGADALAPARV